MRIMQILSIIIAFMLLIGAGIGVYKNKNAASTRDDLKKQSYTEMSETHTEEETLAATETTEEKTTEAEAAVSPATVVQTTAVPVTNAPTTAAPAAPTTATAATTVAPTTAAPTTIAPTTAAPTTAAPTTEAPTTASYGEAHVTGYTEDRTYINEELSQLFKQRLLQNINDERVRCGVGTVKDDIYLDSACVIRSQEIVTNWSHTRPNGERGMYVVADCGGIYQDMVYRLQNGLVCTYSLGENLAYCDMWNRDGSFDIEIADLDYTVTDTNTMKAVIKMADWIFSDWKNSSAHYANMIHASYTNAGLGLTVGLSENGLKRFYVASLFCNF